MISLTTKIKDIPWISHGFFTRRGGASEGIFGSLNAGYGSSDNKDHVTRNRETIASELGVSPDRILALHQIHSNTVITVEQAWSRDALPKADALVTNKPGYAIGILTADCIPALFADKKKKIIGAAHAGWKGAIGGILEKTIAAMTALGSDPADIVCAIGPCIRAGSYEVSEGFQNPFIEQDAANHSFFTPAVRTGHLMFDLPGYARSRLVLTGIGEVIDTAEDTLPQEDVFFSYRRSCLRKEPDYGRQISAIMIKEEGL